LGAYSGEFSEDEASHYISGLLVKDYIATFPPQSPLNFLREFHSRYPLVGIGHWPPLFYGIEALWMTLFSSSKTSVIALAGAITLVTALTIYYIVGPKFGRVAGVFAAVAFVMAPVVQTGSNELMLDVPVALFALLAMLCYAWYLDTNQLRYSLLFGVLASAALLIKGNAAALALLPAFVVLLGGRWDLLRKPSFWAPLPIVLVATGPWYIFTYGLVEQGFRYTWGLTYVTVAIAENARYVLENLGPLVIVFAAIGLGALIFRSAKPADASLLAASALFLSVWAFQAVVPAAIQDRYLAPAFPPLIIMAVHGVYAAYRGLRASRSGSSVLPQQPGKVLITGVFAAMLVAPMVVRAEVLVAPKPVYGLGWAADKVWSLRNTRNPAALIVANGRGEAAAIAELAMRDSALPSLFAVRGSRIFGGGGYNNQDYQPRFANVADLMTAIDEYSIPLLILRRDAREDAWAHIRQVEELLILYPDRLRLAAHNTDVSPAVAVFEIRGNETKELPVQKMMVLTGPRSLGEP
jgi:4-amino-4-deoxy-L-arabinose transferase-like glycosyltransferase